MAGILWADERMQLLRESLSGLTQRQQAIANNISNMDTPGYRALDVPFEQVLGRQLGRDGDMALLQTSDGHMAVQQASMSGASGERSQVVFRTDGNGVDVDAEMERLAETGIQFSAVTQLLAARIAILKSAVSEGRR